jgi:PEP-CTERM motif
VSVSTPIFEFDLVSIDSPLLLTFASFGGLAGSISLFEPSFVGVLLLNDTFDGFQFWPSSSTSVVQIDNVAVRAVPEPSTLLLFGIAAGANRSRRAQAEHRHQQLKASAWSVHFVLASSHTHPCLQ